MYLSIPFMYGSRVECSGRRVRLSVEEEEVGEFAKGIIVAERVHLSAELGQG